MGKCAKSSELSSVHKRRAPLRASEYLATSTETWLEEMGSIGVAGELNRAIYKKAFRKHNLRGRLPPPSLTLGVRLT